MEKQSAARPYKRPKWPEPPKEPHHKIAVNIPTKLYDKIAKRARKGKVSFSTMAVKMMDCGVFDYEDSERYDGGGDG